MEGWISLHRRIKDHWIWTSEKRLKWWLDLLLTVNHEDKKFIINGTLVECKRGQTVKSLESWAKDWNVTKKTVRDFLLLLQSDTMIQYESIKISTRITICNYDSYQIMVNAKETRSKRKVNGKETPGKRELPPNNNDNKIYYDSEIEKNKSADSKILNEYIKYSNFLFGSNKLKEKLEIVLSIEKQLSYEQFKTLYKKHGYDKIAIKTLALNDYKKRTYTSLYSTLLNWLDK